MKCRLQVSLSLVDDDDPDSPVFCDDVKQWCTDNLAGYWTLSREGFYSDQTYFLTGCANDLLLFKLTWAGS